MPTFGKAVKGVTALEEEAPEAGVTGPPRDAFAAEQERLREAEARRKRETTALTRLRDLYDEERGRSEAAAQEVRVKWRDLLRNEKLSELRVEVEALAQAHDRAVARRDATLEMLARDVAEQEEQHRRALRIHLEGLGTTAELHHQRTGAIEEDFASDLQGLRGDFEEERRIIQRKHREQTEELLRVMAAQRAEGAERDAAAVGHFAHLLEETGDKHVEDYNVLRQGLEAQVLGLQRTITQEHERYMSTAEEKMKGYEELTRRDAETAERIAGQHRRIQRLQDNIAHWRATLATTAKEGEARNGAMRAEKDATARHCQELKASMQRWRRGQEERLHETVAAARDARRTLEAQVAKADRILRLSEQCRALETERERVLGFQADQTLEELQQAILHRKPCPWDAPAAPPSPRTVDQTPAPAAADEACEQGALESPAKGADADGTSPPACPAAPEGWGLLANFWAKYNRALLDTTALTQERRQLLEENARLRTLVKQSVDGLSVTDDALSAPNPLLMAGTFKNTMRVAADRSIIRPPVTEAHVVLNNTHRQLALR